MQHRSIQNELEATMKRVASRRVLFVGINFLLVTGVSWGKNTKTITSKTTAAKTATAKARTAKPATVTPRTVLDYFMLLPQEFFAFPKSELKSWVYGENSLGTIVDTKNDYLRMWGDGTQPTIYMALFRHKGRVLVGIYSDSKGGGILYLMRYEKGKWANVTTSMLPIAYNESYHYIIPRYGTTIKVTVGNGEKDYGGNGKEVYGLVWTNGQFKVRHN
jgi:hypothetical protein